MLDAGLAWLSRNVVLLVAGYVVATAVTLLILVVMLAGLPATYFQDGAGVQSRPRGGVNVLVRLARNALGLVLVVLGLFLSLPAIPGQGVLTLLIGVMLMDFPGKRSLEQKLVARPRVFETMNRVRAWLGRPLLVR
jgi:hypothetical protein